MRSWGESIGVGYESASDIGLARERMFECEAGGLGSWGRSIGVGYESTDDVESAGEGTSECKAGGWGAGVDPLVWGMSLLAAFVTVGDIELAGEGMSECEAGGLGSWGGSVGVGYESTDDVREVVDGGDGGNKDEVIGGCRDCMVPWPWS